MRKEVFALLLIVLLSACKNDDDSTNVLSCCGEDTFIIETNNLSGDTEIQIFNVITPNGDGVNDTFVIAGLGAYPINSLKVFSNNTLVFESDSYHLNQMFGSDLVDDSFAQKVFTYELTIDNGDSFKANGTICAIKSPGNNIDGCNLFDLGDELLN